MKKREFLLGSTSLLFNLFTGIFINQLTVPPIVKEYARCLTIFCCTGSCIILGLQSDIFPKGIWKWCYQHLGEIFYIFFGATMVLTLAFTIVYRTLHPAPTFPQPASEKELAQYYCQFLEKRDYLTLYQYMHDTVVIGHSAVPDENTFVRLAHFADKTGGVTGCHYTSKKSGELNCVTSSSLGFGMCEQEYTMRLLVTRSGSSYNVSMRVMIETGGNGTYGTINEIDKL